MRTNRGKPIPLARIYQSCCCSRATRHSPPPFTCCAPPASVPPVSNRIFPKHDYHRHHSIFIPIASCIAYYYTFSFYTLLGTYNCTNTIVHTSRRQFSNYFFFFSLFFFCVLHSFFPLYSFIFVSLECIDR